jgi:hypothetical protein
LSVEGKLLTKSFRVPMFPCTIEMKMARIRLRAQALPTRVYPQQQRAINWTRINGSITAESSVRLSVARKLYEPLPGIMIPTSHPRPVISILEQ